MTDTILFAAPGACSRVTITALEFLKVPFEYRLLRFMKQEMRAPEFLKVNPKGKVPALMIDGHLLTENVAILSYLAATHPEAGLLPKPDSAAASAKILADLNYCASTLHPIVTRIRNPHFFVDNKNAILEVRQKAIEAMKPNFDYIEKRLADAPYWHGEQWSAMDAYLHWIWFRSAEAKFTVADYPAFAVYSQKMGGLEQVQKMLQREKAAEQQLRNEGLID